MGKLPLFCDNGERTIPIYGIEYYRMERKKGQL